MKTKDIFKIARYLKSPIMTIKEVILIRYSKNLDQIIKLSEKINTGTSEHEKLMTRWNDLFFTGIKNAKCIDKLEYFRNKYPTNDKERASEVFFERLDHLEKLATRNSIPTTAAEKPKTKKTNSFVQKIKEGRGPEELRILYCNSEGSKKYAILKDWKQSYHINIKYGQDIESVKEAFENSPYKFVEYNKFAKYNNKAIRKMIKLTNNPSEAHNLHYYCSEIDEIYFINNETKALVFENMFDKISKHIEESEHNKRLKEIYEQ